MREREGNLHLVVAESKKLSDRQEVRTRVHEYEEEASVEIESRKPWVVLEHVEEEDGHLLDEDRVEGEQQLDDVRQVRRVRQALLHLRQRPDHGPVLVARGVESGTVRVLCINFFVTSA